MGQRGFDPWWLHTRVNFVTRIDTGHGDTPILWQFLHRWTGPEGRLVGGPSRTWNDSFVRWLFALGGIGAYAINEDNARDDLCDAFVTGYTPPGLLSLETQLVEHRKSRFIREGTLYLDGSMT